MKNRKKSKKVQQYAETLANSRLAQANGGRMPNGIGVASTIAGREAEARKEKKLKLAREKKERELVKLLGAGYALKSATSKKIQKQIKKQQAKNEQVLKEQQLAQDKIDFAVPIVGLDQVMMCDGRSEVSRLLVSLHKRKAMVTKDKDGVSLLDIQLVDGSTKYPVNMVVRGELAKVFGDKGFKLNRVIDIRNCVAIMRAIRGQPRRIQVEMLVEVRDPLGNLTRPATTFELASERLQKHCTALIQERDEIRARGGIPIEEMIEEERMALPAGGTPVTEKTFFKWLADRKVRYAKEAKEKKENLTKKKRGKFLTGKDLFSKNSAIFVDDEASAGKDVMDQRVTLSDDEDEEGETKEGSGWNNFGGEYACRGAQASEPAAQQTKTGGTIQVGGKDVIVGDASIFLGDDDDLDLDDLDD